MNIGRKLKVKKVKNLKQAYKQIRKQVKDAGNDPNGTFTFEYQGIGYISEGGKFRASEDVVLFDPKEIPKGAKIL